MSGTAACKRRCLRAVAPATWGPLHGRVQAQGGRCVLLLLRGLSAGSGGELLQRRVARSVALACGGCCRASAGRWEGQSVAQATAIARRRRQAQRKQAWRGAARARCAAYCKRHPCQLRWWPGAPMPDHRPQCLLTQVFKATSSQCAALVGLLGRGRAHNALLQPENQKTRNRCTPCRRPSSARRRRRRPTPVTAPPRACA